ncbi:MAG: pseudouridine synthase [Anaerolineae bacterium CG_4_9_14_3_um_filter_57_17]|nr:rRNA pseudouridine synthase [bacterium]NCT21625.1 rRNA pseudouridine synthase [bacterium]OIO85771.1 MAG: hypothetical protein AUK01_05110 [Anaerolineae bacterium CG2_30_57_67]PJB66664.1 MAG: pseudouridine synthase [Anaerolineae bacterium CG_4_9_14_3_um_filter_57_17]
MEERIQKILAQAGIASRRASEELILAGRVRVNGKIAEIGQKADATQDRIDVDGRVIKPPEAKVYIVLHKPRFMLTTVEPERGDSRPTVLDAVPVPERIFPVGRLDFESEGLVLLTNDGDLAQQLSHPRYGHEKEYRVLFARHPDAEQLETWRRGVVLEEGYKTQPADVRIETLVGKGAWVRIVMKEGRKRQIREIGALLALPVVRIVRVRIGSLVLGSLKPKEWRYLTSAEVDALRHRDTPRAKPWVKKRAEGDAGADDEKKKPLNRDHSPRPERNVTQSGAPRKRNPYGKGGGSRSTPSGAEHKKYSSADSSAGDEKKKPFSRGHSPRPERDTTESGAPRKRSSYGKGRNSRSTLPGAGSKKRSPQRRRGQTEK